MHRLCSQVVTTVDTVMKIITPIEKFEKCCLLISWDLLHLNFFFVPLAHAAWSQQALEEYGDCGMKIEKCSLSSR